MITMRTRSNPRLAIPCASSMPRTATARSSGLPGSSVTVSSIRRWRRSSSIPTGSGGASAKRCWPEPASSAQVPRSSWRPSGDRSTSSSAVASVPRTTWSSWRAARRPEAPRGMWRMTVPDAYRAQLYLRRLRLGLNDLAATLSVFGLERHDADAAVESLEIHLAGDLDAIVLPTVALELAIAGHLGLLKGTTPEQRYESFFAADHGWQPWVRA